MLPLVQRFLRHHVAAISNRDENHGLCSNIFTWLLNFFLKRGVFKVHSVFGPSTMPVDTQKTTMELMEELDFDKRQWRQGG